MRIIPFEPSHCQNVKAHLSQAHYQHLLNDPSVFHEQWPETFSALVDDELVAIGGTIALAQQTGGWVLFTDKITPLRFVVIHRAVERALAGIDQSVTVHINPNNPEAVRWARILGACSYV